MNTLQRAATPVVQVDDAPPTPLSPPRLLNMPDEILLSILHRHCSRQDVARLARTGKCAVALCRSVLYNRLVIPSLRALPALLQTIRSSDKIARAVHELVVLDRTAIDPIQASQMLHRSPPSCVLSAWILAFLQSTPSAWHLDLSLVPHNILNALLRSDSVIQHLLPVLSKRKMTLSLPRDARLLHAAGFGPGQTDLMDVAAAGAVIGLERVDFAHLRCTAIISLGPRSAQKPFNGNASPPCTNGSPRHLEPPIMRVEGAYCAGPESAHDPLMQSHSARLNQRYDLPLLNFSNVSCQSATKASISASSCDDIDLATSLAPRASVLQLNLLAVDHAVINEFAIKLPRASKLAFLSCLTLKSITSPITSIVLAAAVHLPHLHSLTLIDLSTPLEPTLAAVDFLIRRPQCHGRALRKLKIAGIFDYLPSESTPTAHILPPYPPTSLASTTPPALSHLILHRKSPSATASHESQTSRIRPRLLLSRALLTTLHTVSVNELDIVVARPEYPPSQHLSLLRPILRGPLAPFHQLSTATLPNLYALRIDVQNLELDGNLLPQSAPRLHCLVAQNLAGDFSRAVAVVDLLATYPRLSHVWLDKNLWLPIAQVHKLGQALFRARAQGQGSRPASPNKKPASGGPRSRLVRDSLPHLDRILVDNAHAQCLVGGRLALPMELPDPPVRVHDDTTSACEGQNGMANMEVGIGAIKVSPTRPAGIGFADGMDMEDTTHAFRPVALDAAMRCREWMEQVHDLV